MGDTTRGLQTPVTSEPPRAGDSSLIDWAILAAAIQLGFVCSLLLWSVLLFMSGVPIRWFHVPAAAFMAGGFGWWMSGKLFPGKSFGAFLAAYGSSAVLFVCYALVERALYDVSWDGQAYQAEAIIQLGRGWNPVYDTLPAGLDWSTLLTFWSKGPWITAAGLYVLTGSLDAGKAFHLLLMTSSGLLASAAMSAVPLPSKRWAIVCSVLLACNPVSLAQMHTYYVDGLLASLITMTVSLLILVTHRPDRPLLILLAGVVVLTMNVKLTAPIYVGIIAAGFVGWHALRSGWGRSWPLATSLVGGGIVGGAFAGFNPYITEFSSRLWASGPRFLLSDWMSLLTIARESPINFSTMNRFEMVAVSLFSKSDVAATREASSLKIPFTLSPSEIQAFTAPDVRIGGFGPLFGGAVLLAAVVLILLVVTHRGGTFRNTLIALSVLTLASVFPNHEAWWARFAPQFWTAAVLILVAGLALVPERARWLPFALAATLGLNLALLYLPNARAAYDASWEVNSELADLKPRPMPVAVQFNRFAATRYRFEREGIHYVEVAALPCSKVDQKHLAFSVAVMCKTD